jgi:hypothetical protein
MSAERWPNSAFRNIDKSKPRCRCGGKLDLGWSLALGDPTGMRTASVPLCSACGPVLFDRLADEGWLTAPLMGETIARAKTELAEKEIVRPCEHCGISGGVFLCVDTAGCAERVAAASTRPRLPADWYSRECPKGCPPGRCNSDDSCSLIDSLLEKNHET